MSLMDKHIKARIEETLAGLKDFQMATVDQVVDLYTSVDHSQRVLVADEVGLGKTLVAKGVIAKLLEKWSMQRPMRVAYICSNLALAEENRQKLSIFTDKVDRATYVREPSFGRLAELGLRAPARPADRHVIEICTLTPATSFATTQGIGNMRERAILLGALLHHKRLSGYEEILEKIFRNDISDSSWIAQRAWVSERSWNRPVVTSFLEKLDSEQVTGIGSSANRAAKSLADHVADYASAIRRGGLGGDSNYQVIRQVRSLFVRCCAGHLDADLFILDEFQRFKEIIERGEDNEQSYVASEVFREDALHKVLLLSATPFKAMTSLAEDEGDEAHLKGLRTVLGFLRKNTPLDAYEVARHGVRSQLTLLSNGTPIAELSDLPRKAVESELRPVICRTERAQIADGIDSVMGTLELDCAAEFSRRDVDAYRALDPVAVALRENHLASLDGQMMEFFKSAAWPLSFAGGYRVRELIDRNEGRCLALDEALRRGQKLLWLRRKQINKYELSVLKDAPNARVRALAKHMLKPEGGGRPELLLWVPPSLPHYRLSGVYGQVPEFSKTLVFSAWAMVPRMLSGLLSYEVERLTLGGKAKGTRYFTKTQKRYGQVLSFDGTSSFGNWSLVYPSRTLALLPLTRSGQELRDVLAERARIFAGMLDALRPRASEGRATENWYALAPMLLDRIHHPGWCENWFSAQEREGNMGGELSGKRRRLSSIRELALSSPEHGLGPMPEDLADFLALLSVAGPAICALRSIESCWIGSPADRLGASATGIAFGFETLFNGEGAGVINALSRQLKGGKSWRNALRYCAEGGIQAVLDEFSHMLISSGYDLDSAATRIASALSVHPSASTVHGGPASGPDAEVFELRCHYAVALGTQKMSDEAGQIRVSNIRESFNSPFRPFVLTSTSIGQEGLDFHWYCSEVVHWNLPDNPIDLEQREGRVNRYKSLTVRRRAVDAVRESLGAQEGWSALFDRAAELPHPTELTPYWHIPEGNQKLKRIVPMWPMSREIARYDVIKKILSLYRLAFGQPRQEDLLSSLLRLNLSDDEMREVREKLIINLAPVRYREVGAPASAQE